MGSQYDVEVLSRSAVFAGIEPDEACALLDNLGAFTRRYEAGSYIRRKGDILDFYPVIMEGRVQASMPEGGQDHFVSEFKTGDSFAEAIPSTIKNSPVNMYVVEDTTLLCIPAVRLDACNEPCAETIRLNLKGELSKKLGILIRALRVLSEPRLTDRILSYLDTLPANPDGSKTVPFSRMDWAGYLRVADKSLIRELRKMQDDGLIEVDGRNIKVM